MPERILLDHIGHSATIGVVVGTFAAVPYVHMQLGSARRFAPQINYLVHDDCSRDSGQLRALCKAYGQEFCTTGSRGKHFNGDLSAFLAGLIWARDRKFDLLVKFSRRFVPLKEWATGLRAMAVRSQASTYSGFSHCHPMLTECVGMHVNSWCMSGAIDKLRAKTEKREYVYVEGYVNRLAREVLQSRHTERVISRTPNLHEPRSGLAYARWEVLEGGRACRQNCHRLWHTTAKAAAYARVAQSWGLDYVEADFASPNREGVLAYLEPTGLANKLNITSDRPRRFYERLRSNRGIGFV
jgi:hypothetical protein